MHLSARVIQVIEAITVRGVGTEDNPHRTVTSYFLLDGKCITEIDPWDEAQRRKTQTQDR